MLGQPRPRRLGRGAALWRTPKGAEGRLHSGTAARADLLLARRMQRGDRTDAAPDSLTVQPQATAARAHGLEARHRDAAPLLLRWDRSSVRRQRWGGDHPLPPQGRGQRDHTLALSRHFATQRLCVNASMHEWYGLHTTNHNSSLTNARVGAQFRQRDVLMGAQA